jgi:mannose/fructose/N-acetylgalactosamine-specific phosphotransferase system component IIC
MQAHAIAAPRQWPDPVAGGAIFLFLVVGAKVPRLAVIALALWLLVRYVITLTRIITAWRHHWVWFNAPAPSGGRAP